MTDSHNVQEELRYSYADMKKAIERAMNATRRHAIKVVRQSADHDSKETIIERLRKI